MMNTHGLLPRILAIAGIFIILAGLRLGEDFFVPLALAVLISSILSPLVSLLQKARLPRALSVSALVIGFFSLLGLLGYFIAGQAAVLGEGLPRYRQNIKSKIAALNLPIIRTLNRVQDVVQDEDSVTESARPEGPIPPARAPVTVAIAGSQADRLKFLGGLLGPAFGFLGACAAVVLLVIFFLIYKDEIADRIIKIAGKSQRGVTTLAMAEAVHGVSRYLALHAILNVSYGVLLGFGLFLFGVPNALLWGFLAAILRFVPYVGPIVAGVLPVLLSVAVMPGWARPIGVAAFIIALEIVTNNLVEPLVYGKRAGLSPPAVVVAAVFWAWLWGAPGLLLSVPLTVCIVAIGRHFPGLNFLAIALGDRPALSVEAQIYQRLLARNEREAVELIDKARKGKSLVELYDTIMARVLQLAETDLDQERIVPETAEFVYRALREIIRDVAAEEDDAIRKTRQEAREPGVPEPDVTSPSIVCLPVGTTPDEISAVMLSQLLTQNGYRAVSSSGTAAANDKLEQMCEEGADLVVMSVLPSSALASVRYLYKRVRRHSPEVPVMLGVWGSAEDAKALGSSLVPDGKATVVTSLAEALRRIPEIVQAAQLQKNARSTA